MRRGLRIFVLTLAALLVAAGVAYADKTIYAGPPSQFVGGDITIDQGEKVTFQNFDTVEHDVTASGKDSAGKPLFQSEKVSAGGSADVAGTEFLPTGRYDYVCSIHPNMIGTIEVSANGAPKKNPGNGGAPGPSPPPGSEAAQDTTPPTVSIKVLDTKRNTVRKRKSLQVSVKMSEAGGVELNAKSGSTVVASSSSKFTKAGTRKVSMKLTKAGLRMLKKSKAMSVTVTASASDGSGNTASDSAGGKLR